MENKVSLYNPEDIGKKKLRVPTNLLKKLEMVVEEDNKKAVKAFLIK